MPPNTEGDEDVIEDELEPEAEPASEESTAATFQQRVEEFDIDPYHLSAYPDQTTYQGLHRTCSSTSANQSLPAIIDSTADAIPLLPPINDVRNKTASSNQTHSRTIVEIDHPTFSSGGFIVETFAEDNHATFSTPQSGAGNPLDANNSSIHLSPPQDIHISPFSSTAFSPSSLPSPRWPVRSAWEAKLFHHFLVHCTPWIDVCDTRCHFGKEVPKRAAQYPVILNGILGLASRHMKLLSKVAEDHSQPYIDSCLEALILALEDPHAHWDENFLVAVS